MKAVKRLIKQRWFWTVIVIGYVLFIFHNSMTPAQESSRQSGRVLEIVLRVVRGLGWEGSWITEHLIRKMAHFWEYMVLGGLLRIAAEQYSAHPVTRRLVQGWIGTMIPLTDETIQLFTEGRSGQISDVWLDMAGVFTGLAVTGLLLLMLLWIGHVRKKE